MSDRRFDDIVSSVQVEYDGYKYYRPGERKPVRSRALCATCGTYWEATMAELSLLDGETEFKYVASMRVGNRCHEGIDSLDGYPDEPDSHRIDGPDTDDYPGTHLPKIGDHHRREPTRTLARREQRTRDASVPTTVGCRDVIADRCIEVTSRLVGFSGSGADGGEDLHSY